MRNPLYLFAAAAVFVGSAWAEDGKFDILWLTSEPDGALVQVNGQDKGTTPLFLAGLPAGNHEISVAKVGYLSEQLTVSLPTADGTQRLVTLRQRPGTCRIESEPSFTSVLHGTQLLGRTPLIVDGLPPGTYELSLIKMGYEKGAVRAEIREGQATSASGKLAPNTGILEIATMPAEAKVFIDGHEMAVGKAAVVGTNKSAPMRFDGLRAGLHKIEIEYRGVRGPAVAGTVRPGEAETQLVMLWYPDVQVRTRAGDTVTGMIIQHSPEGDLVVAKTLTDHVRVLAADILEKTEVPPVEARRLAKDALPKEGPGKGTPPKP